VYIDLHTSLAFDASISKIISIHQWCDFWMSVTILFLRKLVNLKANSGVHVKNVPHFGHPEALYSSMFGSVI
jgi:hypothetical protein